MPRGLREALTACRRGATLVVTKLDRLARSVPDARDIVDELTAGGVRLNIGGSLHDPTDPVGRLLFTTLSMIAEFEADLARARTREGMAVARAKGRSRGKQPKLSPKQEAHLVELYRGGKHTIGELEELFPVTRSTIYRAVARAEAHTAAGERQAETGPFPQCEPELTKIDRSQATQGQPASCADRNDHENTHNRSAASASRG